MQSTNDEYITTTSDPLNVVGTNTEPTAYQENTFEQQTAPVSEPPSNFVSVSSNDPVKNFLRDKQNIASEKKPHRMDEVQQSMEGLKVLCENDCWKEVMKFTEKLIQSNVYPPAQVVQLRLTFVLALLRLRYFEPAQVYFDNQIGNTVQGAQYFYSSYPNSKNEEGTFCPFSLELIQAILPCLKDVTSIKGLDQTYKLLHRIGKELSMYKATPILSPPARVTLMRPRSTKQPPKTITPKQDKKVAQVVGQQTQEKSLEEEEIEMPVAASKKVSLAQWRSRELRVLLILVSIHMGRKEYNCAIPLLEKVIQFYEPVAKKSETSLERWIFLVSLLGSMYLQVGLVQEGIKQYKRVEQVLDVEGELLVCNLSPTLKPEFAVRIYLNRGHVKFAANQYLPAYENFSNALKLDPLNVIAATNKALSLMYTTNLSKAIESLEEYIRTDPNKTLDESVIYNLSTMYDLEVENALQKKRVMYTVIQKYRGDDFSFAALKL